MGERNAEFRQIEAAGRCFASALTQEDKRTMAALLRAAAKYLDGGKVEALNVAQLAGTAVEAAPRSR